MNLSQASSLKHAKLLQEMDNSAKEFLQFLDDLDTPRRKHTRQSQKNEISTINENTHTLDKHTNTNYFTSKKSTEKSNFIKNVNTIEITSKDDITTKNIKKSLNDRQEYYKKLELQAVEGDAEIANEINVEQQHNCHMYSESNQATTEKVQSSKVDCKNKVIKIRNDKVNKEMEIIKMDEKSKIEILETLNDVNANAFINDENDENENFTKICNLAEKKCVIKEYESSGCQESQDYQLDQKVACFKQVLTGVEVINVVKCEEMKVGKLDGVMTNDHTSEKVDQIMTKNGDKVSTVQKPELLPKPKIAKKPLKPPKPVRKVVNPFISTSTTQ